MPKGMRRKKKLERKIIIPGIVTRAIPASPGTKQMAEQRLSMIQRAEELKRVKAKGVKKHVRALKSGQVKSTRGSFSIDKAHKTRHKKKAPKKHEQVQRSQPKTRKAKKSKKSKRGAKPKREKKKQKKKKR